MRSVFGISVIKVSSSDAVSPGSNSLLNNLTSVFSYDYCIGGKVTDTAVFHSIRQLYREKAQLHLVCKIAYLKYFSKQNELFDADAGKHIFHGLFTVFLFFVVFPLNQIVYSHTMPRLSYRLFIRALISAKKWKSSLPTPEPAAKKK